MLFKSIDDALADTDKAIELDLHEQHLTEFPESVGRLEKLEIVNLSGNHDLDIDAVFTVLAKLPNLKKVNVMDCDCDHLPDSIGDFPALEYLHIDNNGLHSLPVSIGNAKTLTNISADNNLIDELPDSFYTLPKLKFASFTNNKLKAISPKLKEMGALITLHLRDNDFDDATKEQIESNLPDSIFIYKL